jgi:hypothetical protein
MHFNQICVSKTKDHKHESKFLYVTFIHPKNKNLGYNYYNYKYIIPLAYIDPSIKACRIKLRILYKQYDS